jgi:hypothetical protein
MMRAGKDYITKGGAPADEPEDARSRHLRELLRAVNGQPAETTDDIPPVEPEEQPEAKPANQDKPTLKLPK